MSRSVLASSLALPHPKPHGIQIAWRLGPQGFRVQFWSGHVRRRECVLQGVGRDGCGRGDTAHRHLPRSRREYVRHGRTAIPTGDGGRNPRPGDLADKRDRVLISTKAYVPHGEGAERSRLVALPPHAARSRTACGGSTPTTSISTNARLRRAHADRRGAGHARTASCTQARSATSAARISPAGT